MVSNMCEPGRITSGIEENSLISGTVSFIQSVLPAWRDDPDRPHEEAEERLNRQLQKFLDARARTEYPMVRFDSEEFQTDQRRVDLAASPSQPTPIGAMTYTIYNPFLVMEGKRLPTPGTGREKEYVTGGEKLNGGIQRFKLELHGRDHDLSVMVGYVQECCPRYWRETINNWITELASNPAEDVCAWSLEEHLLPLSEDRPNGLNSYISNHPRSSGRNIELRHFLIAMNRRVGETR